MPHDDGRKSRCRLVTTITKRSSHMPIDTMIDTMNRQAMLDLAHANQKICGAKPLQKISAQ